MNNRSIRILSAIMVLLFCISSIFFLFYKTILFYGFSLFTYTLFAIILGDILSEEIFVGNSKKSKKYAIRMFFGLFLILPYINITTNLTIGISLQIVLLCISISVIFLFNYIFRIQRFVVMYEYSKYCLDVLTSINSIIFIFSLIWSKEFDNKIKLIFIPISITLVYYNLIILKAAEINREKK